MKGGIIQINLKVFHFNVFILKILNYYFSRKSRPTLITTYLFPGIISFKRLSAILAGFIKDLAFLCLHSLGFSWFCTGSPSYFKAIIGTFLYRFFWVIKSLILLIMKISTDFEKNQTFAIEPLKSNLRFFTLRYFQVVYF